MNKESSTHRAGPDYVGRIARSEQRARTTRQERLGWRLEGSASKAETACEQAKTRQQPRVQTAERTVRMTAARADRSLMEAEACSHLEILKCRSAL